MTSHAISEATERMAIALASDEWSRRRVRERLFADIATSDPDWDILLFLFINQAEPITITRACRAAHAPRTTALRALIRLEEQGRVQRSEAPDRRSNYIGITDHTRRDMLAYLQTPVGTSK